MSDSKYGTKGCLIAVLAFVIIGLSVGLGLPLLRPLILEVMEKRHARLRRYRTARYDTET